MVLKPTYISAWNFTELHVTVVIRGIRFDIDVICGLQLRCVKSHNVRVSISIFSMKI